MAVENLNEGERDRHQTKKEIGHGQIDDEGVSSCSQCLLASYSRDEEEISKGADCDHHYLPGKSKKKAKKQKEAFL